MYALRCDDDSMSPRVRAGESALIDPAVDPGPGDDVLIVTRDGRTTFKRIHAIHAGQVHLGGVRAGDHSRAVLDLADLAAMHYVAGRMTR